MKVFLQLLNGTKELQKKVLGELKTFVEENAPSAGVSSGGALVLTGELSSAQILTLNSNPVEIVPAPGAGRYIKINKFVAYLIVGTPYATNQTLRVGWNNGSFVVGGNLNLLDSTSDTVVSSNPNNTTDNQDLTNAPVELDVLTGNPTAGTGTLKYHIEYEIIDFNSIS